VQLELADTLAQLRVGLAAGHRDLQPRRMPTSRLGLGRGLDIRLADDR
jgi:hypothetical protein